VIVGSPPPQNKRRHDGWAGRTRQTLRALAIADGIEARQDERTRPKLFWLALAQQFPLGCKGA
jgi:hypothetical protein